MCSIVGVFPLPSHTHLVLLQMQLVLHDTDKATHNNARPIQCFCAPHRSNGITGRHKIENGGKCYIVLQIVQRHSACTHRHTLMCIAANEQETGNELVRSFKGRAVAKGKGCWLLLARTGIYLCARERVCVCVHYECGTGDSIIIPSSIAVERCIDILYGELCVVQLLLLLMRIGSLERFGEAWRVVQTIHTTSICYDISISISIYAHISM